MPDGADMPDEITQSSLLRQKRYRERKKRRSQRGKRYYDRHKKRLNRTRLEHAITTYDAFVKAMVARRKQLGWSQIELDERAGFHLGYTGKLEAWTGPQGRTAGPVTMPLWLQALGIEIVFAHTLDGSIADQARELAGIKRKQLPNELAHRQRVRTY